MIYIHPYEMESHKERPPLSSFRRAAPRLMSYKSAEAPLEWALTRSSHVGLHEAVASHEKSLARAGAIQSHLRGLD